MNTRDQVLSVVAHDLRNPLNTIVMAAELLQEIASGLGPSELKQLDTIRRYANTMDTAGGVVFTGDINGNLIVLDAASGHVVHQVQTGAPIGAGIITYEAGGRQYVAVAGGSISPIWPLEKSGEAFFYFAPTSNHGGGRPVPIISLSRALRTGRSCCVEISLTFGEALGMRCYASNLCTYGRVSLAEVVTNARFVSVD